MFPIREHVLFQVYTIENYLFSDFRNDYNVLRAKIISNLSHLFQAMNVHAFFCLLLLPQIKSSEHSECVFRLFFTSLFTSLRFGVIITRWVIFTRFVFQIYEMKSSIMSIGKVIRHGKMIDIPLHNLGEKTLQI